MPRQAGLAVQRGHPPAIVLSADGSTTLLDATPSCSWGSAVT